MNKALNAKATNIPNDWNRSGLPGWTYHSKALFDLEKTEIFLKSWQIAGHVSDIPATGDWLTFDILGERALVMRGKDGQVRAFHNLCRHRGARLADGPAGNCKNAMVCPFHGWVYNLDGTLRGPSRPETFGDLDREKFGLKPIEMEIWHGFIFIRLLPCDRPGIAEMLGEYDEDFTSYRAEELLPAHVPSWGTVLPVNWKSVRDVDNEGYHVAMAHPGLQDLYGRSYRDIVHPSGAISSYAEFGDTPGRLWSVRKYVEISPMQAWLPDRLKKAWTYYGVFPNAVITFTPETAQFYQDIPISLNETRVTGRIYRRAHETREMRAARYLAYRIDRDTSAEDQQLSIWSNESMKSTAFDGFHLSDLEIGVRAHHDEIRKILPVVNLATSPGEENISETNKEMFQTGEITA